MVGGPIEFLGEEPGHEVPATEMGGADGLVQPEKDEVLRGDPEASGGHVWSADTLDRERAGEVSAAMARRGMLPLTVHEGWTGEVDPLTAGGPDGEVYDPVTGRQVPSEVNAAGGAGAGELSDLQP